MYASPPSGETPPAPGLEREEPELMVEEDIPTQGEDEDLQQVERE
jgi:hypothetical protein